MIHDRILFTKYNNWKFTLTKAEGSYLTDQNGHRTLDFTSGWNVANLGWQNPEIASAAKKALDLASYVPGWLDDPYQITLAKKLTAALPKGLNAIARATSGTEANEEAIKTARAYTKRHKILCFKDSYHGHSLATLALGYDPQGELGQAVGPFPAGFVQLDFPTITPSTKDTAALPSNFGQHLEEQLSKNDVAAVLTEAGIITGWGNTAIAPDGYLTLVRRLTKKYGALLILDEVGTGFSRCGHLFGMERENVTPDIVTFAKGLSNGVAPIGAMVSSEEIIRETCHLTNIYSTFGWLPVGCAAATESLAIHQRTKIWEKAVKDGAYLKEQLQKELNAKEQLFDVHGLGMEIGLTYLGKTKEDIGWSDRVAEAAYQKGLHLIGDREKNLQLMPPLTISREDLDRGLELLIDTVRKETA